MEVSRKVVLDTRRLTHGHTRTLETRRRCLGLAGSDAVGWIRWVFASGRKEPLCDGAASFVPRSDTQFCWSRSSQQRQFRIGSSPELVITLLVDALQRISLKTRHGPAEGRRVPPR
jgi:hypothetical protein